MNKPSPKRIRRPRKSGRELEDSRQRLLNAATVEFSRYGLLGARVDVIAKKAKANKQLIYYHFGDKEGLYSAVLEETYSDIRAQEKKLDLERLDPVEAMRKLTEFSFDYLITNPHFIALLVDENVHRGVHIRNSKVLRKLRSPFTGLLAETLERGERVGVFRKGVDPMQFYISLAGLCFFYLTNMHTLSELFGTDLGQPEAFARRRTHVFEFVSGYLRP